MNQENLQKKRPQLGSLAALIPFFKPYKREVFWALFALLITALMILFFGKAIKYMIDFGFVQQSRTFLHLTLLSFVIAVLVMAISGYYRSSLINETSEKVIADLRKKVYNHIIRVSAEFFEITKTGDVISRLTVDTVVLYNVISNTVSFFLRNSILFLGGIFAIFFTSLKLSLVSVMIIPLAIAPIFIMGRKVKNFSNQSQESLALVGSRIEETVNGIKTIQSYLCEEKEVRNFSRFVDDSLAISLGKIRLKAKMIAVVIALAFGGIAVVLWLGGLEVLNGKMTSGDLSSFIFYSVLTATSLVGLSQIAGQMQTASAAAERIFELLRIQSPVREEVVSEIFLNKENVTIKFQDVTFAYPSRKDLAVLKNFNLEIKPNERIAIVGSSGSGKSTILQLLLRFYDVNSGMISLDDHDIKSMSFGDLRKNFSYISQDCFIFSGTIFENIAYIDQSTTEEQVEKLIAENPALDFINHLPQKIHSFVGEKGVKLSGGERQRIALARALIKDAPIMLFDEATSALDNENEQSINRIISSLSKNKTIITIAHKLSTVINSDRIVFLRDGEIREMGSHQELSRQNGLYKKMYEIESEGFNNEIYS